MSTTNIFSGTGRFHTPINFIIKRLLKLAARWLVGNEVSTISYWYQHAKIQSVDSLTDTFHSSTVLPQPTKSSTEPLLQMENSLKAASLLVTCLRVCPPLLRGELQLGPRMVMETFPNEEYFILVMPPEVSDRVAIVAFTRLHR